MSAVELLLDSGANISQEDMQGDTALLVALHHTHSEVVALLVRRGIDVNSAQSPSGYSLLMQACERGSVDMCKALIDLGADMNMKNSEGDTALLIATSLNHSDVVALLIAHGANVHCSDTHGHTTLRYACRLGNCTVVQLLITAGVDVNQVDEQGNSILHELLSGTTHLFTQLLTYPFTHLLVFIR
jgi:ankyrin repeat protein